MLNNNKKKKSTLKNEFDLIRNGGESEEKTKSWITRGHLINIQYVRNVTKLLNIETEVRDLFQALKNVMLCISYQKFATMRSKAMKCIKAIIKINPEVLHENEILKII